MLSDVHDIEHNLVGFSAPHLGHEHGHAHTSLDDNKLLHDAQMLHEAEYVSHDPISATELNAKASIGDSTLFGHPRSHALPVLQQHHLHPHPHSHTPPHEAHHSCAQTQTHLTQGSATGGPKKRKSYTIEFKKNAIQLFDQLKSIAAAATKLGLPKQGGRKMLREWLRNQDKILQLCHQDTHHQAYSKDMKKMHPGKRPVLTQEQEHTIRDWYQEELNKGRTVPNSELTAKAKEVAGMDGFKASSRWVIRFKRNYGIVPITGGRERKRPRHELDERFQSHVDYAAEQEEAFMGDQEHHENEQLLMQQHSYENGDVCCDSAYDISEQCSHDHEEDEKVDGEGGCTQLSAQSFVLMMRTTPDQTCLNTPF
jgi:hypothetical protein